MVRVLSILWMMGANGKKVVPKRFLLLTDDLEAINLQPIGCMVWKLVTESMRQAI